MLDKERAIVCRIHYLLLLLRKCKVLYRSIGKKIFKKKLWRLKIWLAIFQDSRGERNIVSVERNNVAV